MKMNEQQILQILDDCCDAFTFPMLDNGYVYLAATRLTVFRSDDDWALVTEVFGYSPRSGFPDTHIHTFGSKVRNRKKPEDFVSQEAFDLYLKSNPFNESRFIFPLEEGDWIEGETVSSRAEALEVRGTRLRLPTRVDYAKHGIELNTPDGVQVFELCRWLASERRDLVLATADELRGNVPEEMRMILQLNEWNHPDVADFDCRPSGCETFQQLARVIVSGDPGQYRPSLAPNTHWSNWPDGGTL